jgi:hypothetical protein
MANFTAAINALVNERDRVFLLRVAEDYKLPFEELQQKYLETAEQAIKVPRKYKKREAKSVAVAVVTEGAEPAPKPAKVPKAKAEKQCCTAQTSKKEPCKFSALKGEVFCKRHLKQSLGESGAEQAPKPAKKVVKKAEQPVHTHELTAAADADCELCQSHGNPLEEAEVGFEVAAPHTGPVKQLTVAERLAALMAETDEDESEDEVAAPDAEDMSIGEEEFEEDD